MRRWPLLFGFFILILASYLFYCLFQRDTRVYRASKTVSAPDSSWLIAAIDIEGIRKDIAWNTILNGDIELFFKSDTTNNALLKLLKSPADYGIKASSALHYFSKWQNNLLYHGFIVSIEDSEELQKQIGGDSISLKKESAVISRSTEGIWVYDAHNLVFLFEQQYDSSTAINYFNPQTGNIKHLIIPDSSSLFCTINTQFLPEAYKHPILDSTQVSLQLSHTKESLQIQWTYTGLLSKYFTNGKLREAHPQSGLFYSAVHTTENLHVLSNTFPTLDAFYKKHSVLFDQFLTTINHSTVTSSFNGWQKIKHVYYASEMNDEFELVLKKKDTTFLEPVFRFQLEHAEAKISASFLNYLQDQGLISAQKNKRYKVIVGTFDSELYAIQNGIVLQNKNTAHQPFDSLSLYAAFLVQINPSEIKNLGPVKSMHPTALKVFHALSNLEQLRMVGIKNQEELYCSMQIRFKEHEHPLNQAMKLISKYCKPERSDGF